jgi:hypothetical protein
MTCLEKDQGIRYHLPMRHDVHDRVSLELARRIARALPRHPECLDVARANLDRWAEQNSDSPGLLRCYAEWRAILSRPVSEICWLLTAETDEGQRLRQSSPFVGVLSPSEVWEIKRHARETASA